MGLRSRFFFFRNEAAINSKASDSSRKIAKLARQMLLLPYFLLVSVVNYKFIVLTKKKTVELIFLSMR